MLARHWLNRMRRYRLRQTARARRARYSASFCRAAEVLEDRSLLASFIAVGTDAGVLAEVRIFGDRNQDGNFETETTNLPGGYAFAPFAAFAGGARVAIGDLDGDSNQELVVAAGPGGGPHVIVYDLGSEGIPTGVRDSFFAYDASFRGGVFVTIGDINGDGRGELITAPDAGGGSHVKIFSDIDRDGLVSDNLVDSFFAFPGFTGGVRLAIGDVNGFATGAELITAAGPGGGPHVKIWQDVNRNRQVSNEPLLDSFFAYDRNVTGGVYIASGVLPGASFPRHAVVTGPGPGGGPHVKIFADTNGNGRLGDNPLLDQFFAYGQDFRGGVRVSTVIAEQSIPSSFKVITAPGPTGGSHIKVFSDNADPDFLLSNNTPSQFFAYELTVNAGFFVGAGRVLTSNFTSGAAENIPDGGGQLESIIRVPQSAGIIRDVQVSLQIRHFTNSDLTVALFAPNGRVALLFSNAGFNDNGFYVRLTDSAGISIGNIVDSPTDQPVTGTYRPVAPAMLSTFDGLDASGEWRLLVADPFRNNSGVPGALLGWSLHFTH